MLRTALSQSTTCAAIASTHRSSVAAIHGGLAVREFHATVAARAGGPRTPTKFKKTTGTSRTRLVKSITKSTSRRPTTPDSDSPTKPKPNRAFFKDIPGAPEKPFTGKGAYASPYSRKPSMDPASNSLSRRELWMRARAELAKRDPERVDGSSVYRDNEWNAEAKQSASRTYGFKGDIREPRAPPRGSAATIADLRGAEADAQVPALEEFRVRHQERIHGARGFGLRADDPGPPKEEPRRAVRDDEDPAYRPDQDALDRFRTERYPGGSGGGASSMHPRQRRLQEVRDARAARVRADEQASRASQRATSTASGRHDDFSARRISTTQPSSPSRDSRGARNHDDWRTAGFSDRHSERETQQDEGDLDDSSPFSSSNSDIGKPRRWGDELRETSLYAKARRTGGDKAAAAAAPAQASPEAETEDASGDAVSADTKEKDKKRSAKDPSRTGALPGSGAKHRGLPRAFTHTPLVSPRVDAAFHDHAGQESDAEEMWDPESDELPSNFSSPPLMPGLAESVHEVLGPAAEPSSIQRLVLGRFIQPRYTANGSPISSMDIPASVEEDVPIPAPTYTSTLLASETGSGKTLAYLLPVLQGLKHGELVAKARAERGLPDEPQLEHLVGMDYPRFSHRSMAPRALILAPTHELARQLASSTKSLCHIIKMRVLCGSKANKPSTGGPGSRLRDQKRLGWEAIQGATLDEQDPSASSEFTITRESAGALGLGMAPKAKAVDVFTATPARILELVRGNGWERAGEMVDQDESGHGGRKWEVGTPEMGLENVEWVVVDEADVLLDPDFRDHTLAILDDVARARVHLLPPDVREKNDRILTKAAVSGPETTKLKATGPGSHTMPFHLILNSATIPGLLSSTIDARWPGMVRLASPGVHKLPNTMRTEHVAATGNRLADVAKRVERIWADDGRKSESSVDRARSREGRRLGGAGRSKILIFVNRGSKASELSTFLSARGIANITLTGTHGRTHGTNASLVTSGFLNPTKRSSPRAGSSRRTAQEEFKLEDEEEPVMRKQEEDPNSPDVLITTSILSRGLDFSERVRHVLIVDEPRNVVDLLHRAGRSARAGRVGTVTVFGKGDKGAKEVGGAVRSLTT